MPPQREITQMPSVEEPSSPAGAPKEPETPGAPLKGSAGSRLPKDLDRTAEGGMRAGDAAALKAKFLELEGLEASVAKMEELKEAMEGSRDGGRATTGAFIKPYYDKIDRLKASIDNVFRQAQAKRAVSEHQAEIRRNANNAIKEAGKIAKEQRKQDREKAQGEKRKERRAAEELRDDERAKAPKTDLAAKTAAVKEQLMQSAAEMIDILPDTHAGNRAERIKAQFDALWAKENAAASE